MTGLASILPYLIALSAGATAIALFTGLFKMADDSPGHDATTNRMMRWRVGLQGLTLILLALYFLVT